MCISSKSDMATVSGKPADGIPFELVLAEEKAEATKRNRKLMEEPSSPVRPGPLRGKLRKGKGRSGQQGNMRAKIETPSEVCNNQKSLKESKRNREGEAQQEYQNNPASDATDVQKQDSKLRHSLSGLVVSPLRHNNPPPPKEPGASGFFGFLRCPWQHVPCFSACWSQQSLKAIVGRQPSQAVTCTVSNCTRKAFNVTVRSDRHGTCQGSHVVQACVGHCESGAFPSRYSVLVASGYRHNITSASQCCTVSSLKKIKVWLHCAGNLRGELEIFTARACQCDMCRLSRY
ncbi:glycoprotein hormone alpha-2 [Sigmodon hispidus]